MCSRYQFAFKGLEKWGALVSQASGQAKIEQWSGGEIAPGMRAPVLIIEQNRIKLRFQTWGIVGSEGRLMINARAETVLERPLFQADMLCRRCVVPTTGFYEWDAGRHRYLFKNYEQPEVYLAGIYDFADGTERFAILTTSPNDSVRAIHNRMPLVLTKSQIRPWLLDPQRAIALLQEVPPSLKRICEDGQMSLWH